MGTLVLSLSRSIVNTMRNLAWLTPTKDGSNGTVETVGGTAAAAALGAVTVARLSRNDRVVLMRLGSSGAGTLYTYSIDRGAVARVPFDGDVSSPIFGPDTDDYVTFGSQGGVWVAALDGSKAAEPLTAPQSKIQIPASWSSDGTTLVLTELTGDSGDIVCTPARRQTGHAAGGVACG
jgi:hypothetical protein